MDDSTDIIIDFESLPGELVGAIKIVMNAGYASADLLRYNLKVEKNYAKYLLSELESLGIISPAINGKDVLPRKVLLEAPPKDWQVDWFDTYKQKNRFEQYAAGSKETTLNINSELPKCDNLSVHPKFCIACGHQLRGRFCIHCGKDSTREIVSTKHPHAINFYVSTVFGVPMPSAPSVSCEKASKIVSIFSSEWSEIALKEFIVIDLETTGLYRSIDRIVEISAIRYENGIEQDKFYSLVNPECNIPNEAIKVHGITNRMVYKSPKINTVIPDFLQYLGDSLLVAHNANFDIGFIEVWSRRCGFNPTWNYVDTISVAKRILPGLPNYKQKTILDHIGFTQRQYHRAMADCYGCAEIMLLGLNSTAGAF